MKFLKMLRLGLFLNLSNTSLKIIDRLKLLSLMLILLLVILERFIKPLIGLQMEELTKAAKRRVAII